MTPTSDSRPHLEEKAASTATGRANPGRLGALSEIAAFLAEEPEAPVTLQAVVDAAVRATAADAGTLVIVDTVSGPMAFARGNLARTAGGPVLDLELRAAGPSLGWLALARAPGRQEFCGPDRLFAETLVAQVVETLEEERRKRARPAAAKEGRRLRLRRAAGPSPTSRDSVGWSLDLLRPATQELVTLTRLEHDPPATAEPVALAAVLERRAQAFVAIAGRRRVRLRVEERGAGAVVRVNTAEIELAVDALVANAIALSPEGGTVVLAAEVESQSVRIAVEDAGPGVDAAERERLFEPFAHQGQLGLAVVGSVARRAQGRVSVEDAPAGGARFVLELPSA